MAEYIERDRLIEDLTELAKYQTGERQQGILGVIETIRIRKAADVAQIRHGRWIGGDYDKCSVCGGLELGRTNYCPHCGAKMDEEAKK